MCATEQHSETENGILEEDNMLIQIQRDRDHFDYVRGPQLDALIVNNKIERFRRATGWVTVGRDPVRDVSKVRVEQKKLCD